MYKIFDLGKKLFPICRSLTGRGVRQTLNMMNEFEPMLKIKSMKSGKKVYDWKIPDEWNIYDAYVLDDKSKKIIDFKKNNLHLIGYSSPINKKISKKELFQRLYSIPGQPTAIPYITSYYKKYWGFCVADNDKKKIKNRLKNIENNKKVLFAKINSTFNKKGKLNYGEIYIPGLSKKEIFLSTYICHPSMANNELSGPLVSLALAKYFKKKKNYYSIRFIFVPETVGAIAYLKKNLNKLKKNVIAGYNLTCLGDNKNYSFLPTKYDNSLSDRAARKAFRKLKIKYKEYSFLKRGSDERQYNSPGIDLPIASIMRSKYGTYKEYHTSLDNFDFISIKGLNGSYKILRESIKILNQSLIPKSRVLCEPHLSKYNLYPTLSKKNINNFSQSILDFIQFSDGKNDLSKISETLKIDIKKIKKIYKILINKGLIVRL